MIFVKDVSLQYGSQIIFDEISCTVNKTDRIGLVGRNGAGKSTFLKVIDGMIGIDAGSIEMQRGCKVAYMPQEVVIKSEKNVVDETMSALAHLFLMHEEKEKLFVKIQDDATEHDMIRYAELEHELLEQNFDYKKVQALKILQGLGFDEKKQLQSVSQLSVGWRMRVVLAKLLLQDADFYLFDEPTNHLDLSAKNWFLNFLKQGDFGFMLVCHDRYFLDKVCDKTFELSFGRLTVYYGNYSYYLEQRSIRLHYQQQAYEQQQREIKQKEKTIERFKASASKATSMQSMLKKLDKIERIEVEQPPKIISLKMTPPARSGQYVLTVKNVGFGYTTPLFKNVSFELEREDKVALIAPNGTGKTTLFNLIAHKLSCTQGSITLGHQVTTALFDQDQEKVLDPDKTIYQEICDSVPQATEAQIRSVLGAFLFSGDDVFKLIKVLSGGERNRVAMVKIILSKANFFLLDEPTNHLDIESKEVILAALQNYQGTILFVSHDQDFVQRLATKIVELHADGVTVFPGTYEAYLQHKMTLENTKTGSNVVQEKKSEKAEAKVSSIDKKELYELQKKAKNMTNRIAANEKRQLQILDEMGKAEYGSELHQKLQKEFEAVEKSLKDTQKDLGILSAKINKG